MPKIVSFIIKATAMHQKDSLLRILTLPQLKHTNLFVGACVCKMFLYGKIILNGLSISLHSNYE